MSHLLRSAVHLHLQARLGERREGLLSDLARAVQLHSTSSTHLHLCCTLHCISPRGKTSLSRQLVVLALCLSASPLAVGVVATGMSATPLDLLREVLESESAQPQVTPPQLQPQQRAPPQPPQPKSTFAPPAKSRSKRVTKQSKAPSPAQEAQEPTLAGSSNATHRCSQCKQEKTLGHFPTRLTTLQPFLVCKSHLWYWTPEKKELHWAPESESSIDVVCDEVQLVLDGDKTSGSWIVSGTAEDRSAFVNRIAAVQGWVAQSM